MTLVAVPPEIESEPPPPIAIAGPEPSVIVSSPPSAGVVEKTLSTSSGLPSAFQTASPSSPTAIVVPEPSVIVSPPVPPKTTSLPAPGSIQSAPPMPGATVATVESVSGRCPERVAADDGVRDAGRDRVDAANRVVGREDAAERERQAAEADGACGGVELAAVAEDHVDRGTAADGVVPRAADRDRVAAAEVDRVAAADRRARREDAVDVARVAVEEPVDLAAVTERDRVAAADDHVVVARAAEDDVRARARREGVVAAGRVVGRHDPVERQRQVPELRAGRGGDDRPVVAEHDVHAGAARVRVVAGAED